MISHSTTFVMGSGLMIDVKRSMMLERSATRSLRRLLGSWMESYHKLLLLVMVSGLIFIMAMLTISRLNRCKA